MPVLRGLLLLFWVIVGIGAALEGFGRALSWLILGR
jgi:hypothetical protein